MRAGGVTFLLGLALIHVSWAVTIPGNSNDAEEEPTALADGVKFYGKKGYVFDGDEIFTEQATSILKYSAEAMKECTTTECRRYAYYKKIGSNVMGLGVILINLTDPITEFGKPEMVKSDAVWKAGYIFDNDETFTEKANSLFQHSLPVMKQCTTRECRSYTYGIKVGDNILCLKLRLIPEKRSDALNEELLNKDEEEPLHVKKGYIFDDDEIFAGRSDALLIYSAKVMRTCTTKACRSYTVCNRKDEEMICLSVWLSKGANEVIDDLNYFDLYDEPNDVQEVDNEGFLYRELDDNNELLEGKERKDEFKTQVKEEKQKEVLSEDKVEDDSLA